MTGCQTGKQHANSPVVKGVFSSCWKNGVQLFLNNYGVPNVVGIGNGILFPLAFREGMENTTTLLLLLCVY